jgi:hypothetical protein
VSVELPGDVVIRTPDQRLTVFVSSTLGELADERRAVLRAVSTLRLTPVLFELGADGFEEAFAAGSRLHQREAVSRRAGPARRRPPGVRAAAMSTKLDPHRPFQRFPLLPHQMRDRRTRTEDAIVLCHLGVPRIEACVGRRPAGRGAGRQPAPARGALRLVARR